MKSNRRFIIPLLSLQRKKYPTQEINPFSRMLLRKISLMTQFRCGDLVVILIEDFDARRRKQACNILVKLLVFDKEDLIGEMYMCQYEWMFIRFFFFHIYLHVFFEFFKNLEAFHRLYFFNFFFLYLMERREIYLLMTLEKLKKLLVNCFDLMLKRKRIIEKGCIFIE